MKKIFEKPEIEITVIGNTDIIATSDVSDVSAYGHEVWSPWLETNI